MLQGIFLSALLIFPAALVAPLLPQSVRFSLKSMTSFSRTGQQDMPLNRSLFNPSLYARIQHVWFEGLPEDAITYNEAVTKKWFPRDNESKVAFDGVCRLEFKDALDSIGPLNVRLEDKEQKTKILDCLVKEIKDADSRIGPTKTAQSLLILLDQIPRNLFRTKETLPLVFNHYDKFSISLLRNILSWPESQRPDLDPSIRLNPPRRIWFYMPLMHSESQEDHEKFTEILDEWLKEVTNMAGEEAEKVKENVERFKSYEERHAKIVQQFGRYPHRNGALGRQMTREEEKWLADGGDSFGVAQG